MHILAVCFESIDVTKNEKIFTKRFSTNKKLPCEDPPRDSAGAVAGTNIKRPPCVKGAVSAQRRLRDCICYHLG